MHWSRPLENLIGFLKTLGYITLVMAPVLLFFGLAYVGFYPDSSAAAAIAMLVSGVWIWIMSRPL